VLAADLLALPWLFVQLAFWLFLYGMVLVSAAAVILAPPVFAARLLVRRWRRA
jgi:multisubunit Na+/H+ antiporter MnhE subunit